MLIIGGGAAGHACAAALHRAQFAGTVSVIDAEAGGPITRTLLDTAVLPGLLTPEQIRLPGVEGVTLLHARVHRLHLHGTPGRPHVVVLADGRSVEADAVLLACGSAPRGAGTRLRIEAGAQVHSLHTIADIEAIRRAIPDPAGRRVAVLGAGFIGTEVATHFAGAGAEVVLIGRSELPLRSVVGGAVARRLADLHRARVDARLGLEVREVRVVRSPRDARGISGPGAELVLSDGSQVEVDAVILAHGTDPATGWAGMPGGAVVDDRLRVVDERVVSRSGRPGGGEQDAAAAKPSGLYAAGGAAVLDVAGHRVRIDHWDDAASQGAHAAATVLSDLGLGPDPGPYLPRAGFTLMAHGAAVAGRGVRLPGAAERDRTVEDGTGASTGEVTEFIAANGRLCGIAGINAGPAVSRGAARLFAEEP